MPKDSGSLGRGVLAVRHRAAAYVLAFQLAGKARKRAALEQAEARGYAQKHLRAGRPV